MARYIQPSTFVNVDSLRSYNPKRKNELKWFSQVTNVCGRAEWEHFKNNVFDSGTNMWKSVENATNLQVIDRIANYYEVALKQMWGCHLGKMSDKAAGELAAQYDTAKTKRKLAHLFSGGTAATGKIHLRLSTRIKSEGNDIKVWMTQDDVEAISQDGALTHLGFVYNNSMLFLDVRTFGDLYRAGCDYIDYSYKQANQSINLRERNEKGLAKFVSCEKDGYWNVVFSVKELFEEGLIADYLKYDLNANTISTKTKKTRKITMSSSPKFQSFELKRRGCGNVTTLAIDIQTGLSAQFRSVKDAYEYYTFATNKTPEGYTAFCKNIRANTKRALELKLSQRQSKTIYRLDNTDVIFLHITTALSPKNIKEYLELLRACKPEKKKVSSIRVAPLSDITCCSTMKRVKLGSLVKRESIYISKKLTDPTRLERTEFLAEKRSGKHRTQCRRE